MRKIKIGGDLRKKVKNFNKNLFIGKEATFKKPKSRLEDLSKKIKPRKHKSFKQYVEKIIAEYDDILNADPKKMRDFIVEFNRLVPNTQMFEKIIGKNGVFHEQVVYAMRYEDIRSEEFPKYLLSSNLKTCVYCNAQSTLTIEPVYYNKKKKKGRKKTLSKLQLDHFYPKSKYPFLSTSFFNLYPTCANCNLAKGKENADFELYTLDDDVDVFHFSIDDKSFIDYWTKLDLNTLKIELQTLNGDKKLQENHNDLFQIQKIYDANKDIGEELVWKAKANPKAYKDMLSKEFSKLFSDASAIDRMIIGNYSKPEEIFKRPLSKYTQDIARELKLIK